MASPLEPRPVIPAEVTLPEITVKAVILSVVLAAVLAGANAYLGLFAGMTVSASIPAAVISMAVLRLFRESNILENNIVQTAASSGEALAAGVIFTIPALLLIGDRKSTRLNSSHLVISYAVFCLKKKKKREMIQLLAEVRSSTDPATFC